MVIAMLSFAARFPGLSPSVADSSFVVVVETPTLTFNEGLASAPGATQIGAPDRCHCIRCVIRRLERIHLISPVKLTARNVFAIASGSFGPDADSSNIGS